MTRGWKPGDVGVLDSGVRVFFVGEDMDRSEPRPWRTERGGALWGDMEIRPLVVIDPEHREQVARLVDLFDGAFNDVRCDGAGPTAADLAQVALRVLVADPKPEEPIGLGAVVEDADRAIWVRAARIKHGWHRPMNMWAAYDDIDVVRVLSEGVIA